MAANGMIFSEVFATEMKKWSRQTMESEVAHLLSYARDGSTIMGGFPTEEDRAEAKRRVDKLSDGDVHAYLRATTPDPCPTCGHA